MQYNHAIMALQVLIVIAGVALTPTVQGLLGRVSLTLGTVWYTAVTALLVVFLLVPFRAGIVLAAAGLKRERQSQEALTNQEGAPGVLGGLCLVQVAFWIAVWLVSSCSSATQAVR